MTVKTRGSAALDKAQRRLALLKSIDEKLDFGHDLSVAAYSKLIDDIRTELEDYNTQLSEVAEKRKTVSQKEKMLSAMSSRMLPGLPAVMAEPALNMSWQVALTVSAVALGRRQQRLIAQHRCWRRFERSGWGVAKLATPYF
jgi:hypothetical protein